MSLLPLVLSPAGQYCEIDTVLTSPSNRILLYTGTAATGGSGTWSSNIVFNGGGEGTTDWANPGTGVSAGFADGWYRTTSGISGSIVTGNGFAGNAQRWWNWTTIYSNNAISQYFPTAAPSGTYDFKLIFKYRAYNAAVGTAGGTAFWIQIGRYPGPWATFMMPSNTGNAISSGTLTFTLSSATGVNQIYVGGIAQIGTGASWHEVDEINLWYR